VGVKELPKKAVDRLLGTPYGEAAYAVVETLVDAGFEAWWVGGGTRDLALGIAPKDIDIATSATPDEVTTVFKDAKRDPLSLGGMRVKKNAFTFELTTFREEGDSSNARHPESVTFTTREKDVARRDFTLNAVYYQPVSREVYDPTEGLADAEEKLVRFIGEPGERIKHDALRMLRAVRLRALIGGQYHPETYAALRANAGLVSHLSGSRQLEELEKMLAGPKPSRALEDLWEFGIMERMIPELHACKGIAQPADYHHEGDVWDHTLACADAFRPDDGADVRIAALFHDIGKAETFALKERIRFDHHASVSADTASAILKRWQVPAKRVEKIDWLIRHHMTMGFSELSDERKAHWYHHPWFAELLRVFWLDIAGTTPSDYAFYDAIVKDYHAFVDATPRPPKQLLTGADVMDILGISPGEKVGEVLQKLHDAQVKKEVTTKAEAKAFVSALASRQ
jgi:putative nucleotidyltransferase with HDIG domain